MSNGSDVIKIVLIFVGIMSAVGLITAVIILSDIGKIDDPQNLTGEQVGWKIVDMLNFVIVFAFGSILTGIIIAFLRSAGGG